MNMYISVGAELCSAAAKYMCSSTPPGLPFFLIDLKIIFKLRLDHFIQRTMWTEIIVVIYPSIIMN